ncbi:lipocalin family protein, partial [Capnocytophaga sputigena]|uniref:lipocalin family protein n=1 Tax=Capnocytophaga sputigena TaxID=1019 RepID=UPI0028D81B7B
MKKIIFSAFIATALFVSSCGKDDDNGGGSTSLNGDWYTHTMYNYSGINGKDMSWAAPNNCSKRSYRSFSDTQIKHEWYHLEGSECKYTPIYYDYTLSNGEINVTVANNSPNGTKGQKLDPVKYEMKGKELILRFTNNLGLQETNVLHKKGEDYSYLAPLVGYWKLTKIEAGGTTYPAGTPA